MSSPLLAVNVHRRAIGPRLIDPAVNLLQWLYASPVLLVLLLAIGVAHEWLYLVHGTGRSIGSVLYAPALALAVIAILVLGNVVHEFGHAAALRYGGGRAREIGVALYLIYPALYTDTTDSYRLGRWARVRTDLGGFYFHLLFASTVVGLAVLVRQEWLLLVAVLIDFDVLYQLLPFVRFDGYWAFADLTGIPDFFSQMSPFLRAVLPLPPRARRGNRLPALKQWVKVAFAVYMAVTVPLLVFLAVTLIVHLPQLAVTSWDSLRLQAASLSAAWQHGDPARAALALLQIAVLAAETAGILYLLLSFARRVWLHVRGGLLKAGRLRRC